MEKKKIRRRGGGKTFDSLESKSMAAAVPLA